MSSSWALRRVESRVGRTVRGAARIVSTRSGSIDAICVRLMGTPKCWSGSFDRKMSVSTCVLCERSQGTIKILIEDDLNSSCDQDEAAYLAMIVHEIR